MTGEWAGKRINLYGPSLRYQAALLFSQKVLQSSDKWNEALHAYGNLRQPDGTNYGWAAQMTDAMKKDPYSIGLFHYSENFSADLRVVSLAKNETGPYIEHTIENVQNRSYPLWLEQSFYASVKPGTKMDPKVREFLLYVLSQEGQDAVQRDGKYLPLTAEVVREQLPKVK